MGKSSLLCLSGEGGESATTRKWHCYRHDLAQNMLISSHASLNDRGEVDRMMGEVEMGHKVGVTDLASN